MQRAGAAAAAEIVRRLGDRLGGGRRGGHRAGEQRRRRLGRRARAARGRGCACASWSVRERARATRAPSARRRSPRAWRRRIASMSCLSGGESIVVDALLGTGLSADGPLRGDIAAAVETLRRLADRGASLVALDVPTGLDASTGRSAGRCAATLTITFGTIKRGHLVARDACGDDRRRRHRARRARARRGRADAARVGRWFAESLPRIAADAHKGTRRKVAIVGGAKGMAGAVVLAARAALRSGAGLVRCVVAPESFRRSRRASRRRSRPRGRRTTRSSRRSRTGPTRC